ncbi:succinyl-diaminopimelate desuccinylase [Methylocystis heyeri]|uniref:Succinyl-diaminopimelate desuccinylase n=1 Tax=Methylocystis heyeri TaxID=391905 RepID=A0A6B8KM01_9HYPH|nr:succinyl-diaminopimelate desuccinylase [Methylocystis heyeri]
MALSPAVALTRELLRCPSVTPADAGALGVLERTLAAAGFVCRRKTFSAPGTPDIDNLFAKIGTGKPHLVFAGHTDVVPPGDIARWRFDPFSGEIADGKIYGRGASDMKGGIAAFVAAALDYVARHGAPKGAISLLITGDEEGPSINGTAKLLDWAKGQGEIFDHCIVGEPTNVNALGDMMKIGRRGSLNGVVVAQGRQGHVAYPERAHNPVPAIARIAAALASCRLDDGTAHFSPSNLEVTSIDVGNPAVNVIPARARASFNIRFNDLWTPETLQARIRELALAAAGATAIELEFAPCNARAFLTEPGAFTELVAKAVEKIAGRRPELSTSGGTSDARFIVRDCEVLEFGLLNETIHAVDENASLADIDALTAIYGLVLQNYFEAP